MMGIDLAGDARAVAHARVSFREFRSPDDPMLLAWTRFRTSLSAAPRRAAAAVEERIAPSPSHRSGLWRLLATNNRELGRSFHLYGRYDVARSHVEELQRNPDALTIEHIPGPTNGSRGWVILAGPSPIMTCSRWYSSMSTGAVAATGALEAFRTAVLASEPERNSASGRLRRRPSVRADAGSR